MASSSGGHVKRKPHYSCMEQPSLVKKLRGILSDYPDGGQILKEMIQNADDAGATELKIMLESRRINRDLKEDSPLFTKFFQAPALCIYNDAEFTDDDWRGIRMIDCSVKEEDSLTVGRFGLGFKSVFHITDYPCVISGDTILLIDPQRPTDEVNAILKIDEIHEIEGIETCDILRAVGGKYGFDKTVVEKGYFRGTMFWFPLRENSSPISNVYDVNKVDQLFDSLHGESSSILIFLKSLMCINLSKMTQSGHENHVLRVQIQDQEEIQQKRKSFFSCIKSASSEKDEECIFKMTIKETTPVTTQLTQWLVVNYYIVHNVSNDFKRLIHSSKLGLSPCVGVAAKIQPLSAVEGHIFSFLPLPKEGTPLTGLPFHVNGFFALSKNRHHLKWAADDQYHKYVNDEILWNERLLTEALPRAFEKALETAIHMAVTNENKSTLVGGVYLWIPNLETVLEKWKRFFINALHLCEDKSIVFCEQFNSWKRLSEAVFTTFLNLPHKLEFVKSPVRNAIGICGQCPVEVPKHVFLTYSSLFGQQINDISPFRLASILKNNQKYKYMTDGEKKALITYLTSDGTIETLEGLDLLLLASGEWDTFKRNGSSKYICSETETYMFPGSERQFIAPYERLDQCSKEVMRFICEKNYFPIRDLNDAILKKLLLQTLQSHVGPSCMITETSHLNLNWLKDVWSSISYRGIRNCLDVPIFPVLESGSFESKYQVKLVNLHNSDLLLNYERTGNRITCLGNDVERSLRLLGFTVITQLPNWLSCDLIKDFLIRPTTEEVKQLFNRKSNLIDQQNINLFNRDATLSNRSSLLDFVALFDSIDGDLVKMLQKLQLFRSIKQEGTFVTADCYTYFVKESELDKFPHNIELPENCIIVKGNEEAFAKKLGCTKLTLHKLMRVKVAVPTFDISKKENKNVMIFFLNNIEMFPSLIDTVSEMRLIKDTAGRKVQPSDIFDPFDEYLCRLFYGEHVFPEAKDKLRPHRDAFIKLGMKGVSKILPENICAVAKTIDSMSQVDDKMYDKAKALQDYIENNPGVLRQTLRFGKNLGDEIKDLLCFVYCSPEECEWHNRFPQLLNWFSTKRRVCCPGDMKEIKFWQLACSSMPLIKTRSTALSSFYGWNIPPSAEKIILQLKSIQQCSISSDMTLELLTVLKTIYQALSIQSNPVVREAIVSNALVWTADNFQDPAKVIVIQVEDDIELKPYMYFLPPELCSLHTFFTWLGCHSRQDEHVLVSVLQCMKTKYLSRKLSQAETKKDLKCAQMVLERLSEADIDSSWASDNILMVVHSNSDQTIKFARLSECVYDDDPTNFNDVVDGENRFYVHDQIPLRVAEKLGVMSVTRHSLSEAQDFDHWGQQESFTTRLRSLLRDGYTDGLSVPKELLQNADDAGATEISFVYDERKHSDSRDRLLSKSLSDFQGSALWCYNNTVFSEKDLRNIIKFNNSAKSEDVTKIGKFGLGFNAVYNITDIPSFVSGADMVIFDPHEKYLDDKSTSKRSNGKRIPLSKRTLVKRHTAQFKPFQGMFGCNVLNDPFEPYQGTLFRFPLRTAQQADQSEICKTVYSHSEVQSLLEMLMKSAEKLLLFCQNVLSIKLFHISANATSSNEMKTIYVVQKDSFRHTGKSCTRLETGILKKVASVYEYQCDFGMEEQHTVNIRQTFYEHASLFPNLIYSGADLNVTWLVTWISKNGPKQLKIVDTVPLVAVATPCKAENDWICQPLETLTKGNYDTGHMFCFLPLPIKTGLSFHVNGCFRVSDDRQRLTLLNEDDKKTGSKFLAHEWNLFLLQDPLVTALMSHIQTTNPFCEKNEDAYRIWPRHSNPDVFPFVASFYSAVVNQNRSVFNDRRKNIPFSKILILEKMTFNSHFGALFDFLLNVPFVKDRTVVDVPDFVCNNLRLFNKDKASIVERAFISKTDALVHFLHHVSDSYWTNKKTVRNTLLAFTIMEADENVKQCFKTIPCITTEPFGRLRSVLDLVHPQSKLAKMFFDIDERFITKCKQLNELKIFSKLVEFGMNYESLTCDLIFDRCTSLETLSRTCVQCTRIRMGYLLKFLAESNIPKATFNKLQCCRFLPVLQKPLEWTFTWEADIHGNHLICESDVNCSKHVSKTYPVLVLGKPEDLFRMDCYTTVGSINSIVDEKDWISSSLLKNFGVRDSNDLTICMLMEQLNIIGTEFEECTNRYTGETHTIVANIYKELDRLTINMSTDEFKNSIASNFSSTLLKPIIEVDKTLVSAEKVAKSSVRSCPPYLYGLPKVSISRWRIFEKLGVKECFSVSDIIRVLEIKAYENKNNVQLHIKPMVNILENLVECLNREQKSYEDIKQYEECIIAPDREGRFLPTSQLALEDIEVPTKSRLSLLNDDICPSLGKAIGVRSKRLQLIRQHTRAIPFGQREKLTTRLNNLLKEYPSDETIIKELIQNADDACAHELHFIKYYENRTVGKSLEHGENLQPALCVYNDRCFTENDFEGIQNLGIGSKAEDPSKTGQFGVGFNAVYHITDTPSFLTKGPGLGENGHVCMFDPLFKHISDISDGQPGIRYNVDDLTDDFPDTTIGFPPMPDACGTMFRLPLRQEESVISKSCLTTFDVDCILDNFTKIMPDCLHFLKHVRKMKIMKYEQEKYTEEYVVESELIDDEDKERQSDFFNELNKRVNCNVSNKKNYLIEKPFNVLYKLRIHDSKNMDTTWLVVHQFGASVHGETRLESVQELLRHNDLALLPIGGISLKLCPGNVKGFFQNFLKRKDFTKNNHLTWDAADGKLYCFLPLPEFTGLPFNINGHFALDRARRGLWKEGFRMEWNKFLLSAVVTEATLKAFLFLTSYWIDCNIDIIRKKWFLRDCFQIYFNHFPKHEHAKQIYWEFFVKELYRSAIEQQIRIFPCVFETQKVKEQGAVSEKQFFIKWIHLATNLKFINGAVVDTFRKHCCSKEDCLLIKSTLGAMSINMSTVDLAVVKTMEKAGQNSILKTDPCVVMQIVKDRVNRVQCCVKDTVIVNTNVAKSIVRYISQYERFNDEICDLPMCITNDNFLRKFSSGSNIFCTEYCAILPSSLELFLHNELVPLLHSDKLVEATVLSRFTFQKFVELLPLSYNPKIFFIGRNVTWKSSDRNPIEPGTIRLLWKFIFEESKRMRLLAKKPQKANVFERNVKCISGWSFLPSKRGQFIHELIPIQRAYTLLSDVFNPDIQTFAEKANIGIVDTSVFNEESILDSEVITAMKSMIAHTYSPEEVLRCVHYHKSDFASCNISSDEAFKLLRWFNQNTEILKSKLGKQAKLFLKELPLYETMQKGSFVSLDENADVVVLSSEMPPEGLNEWAQSVGTIVVKENTQLVDLYTFLELPHKNDLDMYVRNIFPNIAHMPRNAWLTHIEHVKDHMLLTLRGKDFSEMQNRLIDIIKDIPFIDIDEKGYCARELYDRDHAVFAKMLTEEQFLPQYFMDSIWKDFMKIIGLNIRPTGAMMLDYAKEIARKGALGITDDLIAASDVLVSCLFGDFQDTFDDHVFDSIKTIRFVAPCTIPTELEYMFRAYCSKQLFISFEGSCSLTSADICWTSVSLTKRDPEEKFMALLGISHEPKVDSVIKHCQNICSVFEDDIKSGRNQHQNKLYYMEMIFSFLENNMNHVNARLLENVPVILIPKEAMVKASNVFVSAPDRAELKPYLYKVPQQFQRYVELFKKLGSSPEPTMLQYANVLKTIKEQFAQNEIPANILEIVSKAIQYFFEILITRTDEVRKQIEKISYLYLPNQEKILTNSCELILSDNKMYRKELEEKCRLNIFLGLAELNIRLSNCMKPFELLPQALKPRVLSEDVKEIISTEDIIEINSEEAEHFQNFICSTDVFEGLCRLVRNDEIHVDEHSLKYNNELQNTLLNIMIKEVSGLKTLLCFKGDIVKGVAIEKEFYIKTTMTVEQDSEREFASYILYYQTDNSDNAGYVNSSLRAGLMSLINMFTQEKLSRNSIFLLQQLLDLNKSPEKIGQFLDRQHIQELDNFPDRKVLAFPPPGKYVEERFYRFMVQTIVPFLIHEYRFVALEIENGDNDDLISNVRYVYAHIEKEIRPDISSALSIRYLVNIGCRRGGKIEVPIFRLFKFIPLSAETSQELVEYDSEPISSIPFDTNCHRIMEELQEAFENFNIQDRKKIIRRMLLRWHPDRNPDHEEYSKRVFYFIQNCILKLERGEQVIINPDPHLPDMRSSRYWNVCVDVTNTGQVHTRGYQENLEEFNKFNRRGPHSSSVRPPVSSPGEYKRWIKQAKLDFQTGQCQLNCSEQHPETYNWICYNCHQACEKALKAAWFLKDANKCRVREHSLASISRGLDVKIVQTAIEFEDRLCIQGPANFRLRYPDSVNSCQIPSEVFSKEDAEYAVTTAKTILQLVEELSR